MANRQVKIQQEGNRTRSGNLRQRLIEVAISEFGQHGFDGVGTRTIAAKAKTTMSAITYHFGSKQGLYLSCAESIADRIGSGLEESAEVTEGFSSPSEALEHCRQTLLAFVQIMASEQSAPWSSFILREQQTPTEAFSIISERMFDPMIKRFKAALRLRRPELSDVDIEALSVLLIGMPISLRTARSGVLRQFGKTEFDNDLIDLFSAHIEEVLNCVTRPLLDQKPG